MSPFIDLRADVPRYWVLLCFQKICSVTFIYRNGNKYGFPVIKTIDEKQYRWPLHNPAALRDAVRELISARR